MNMSFIGIDCVSTASTISSAHSDDEDQEDIVKDSGATISKVCRDFSDSEPEDADVWKSNFSDISNKSIENYIAKIEVTGEAISTTISGDLASEKDFKSELDKVVSLVKKFEGDLRRQTKNNASLQSKLTEQTNLANDLAEENFRLNEELLESRRVNWIWTKPKIEEAAESGVEAPERSFELELKNVSLVMQPRKNVSLVKKVEVNSRLLSICHWSLQEELKAKKVSNEYVRFLKLSEKHLEDKNFHLKEEILASPKASLEQSNDLTIQKFEKVPKEEFFDSNPECAIKSGPDLEKIKQAISEIIDMKAELEQVKLKNAKKLQEKDQALIEAYKNFNDMKTESLKWNREKLQNEKIIQDKDNFIKSLKDIIDMDAKIVQEKDQDLIEAHKNLCDMKTESLKWNEKKLQDKDNFIESLKSIIDMDAKILQEKHLALTEASKQLIDLKAQAIIHVQLQEKVNQRNEKLVHEKDKAISELIDMKAELEQEKLQNAKIFQENDQPLTAVLPEMFSKLTI